MKRYATRLRVRLSMSAAMLAFLPGRTIAELCSEFDAAGRRGNARVSRAAYPALSWLAAAPRRRSGTGFRDKRPRAVHRGELNRREALRTCGRRGRDGRAVVSERAEALARDERWRRGRSGGPQRDGFDHGRAQG